ncbi:hypothetical protein [uncultured Cytophaga sp.]|uniref:hypothetical protein n=1 Tax=uncultured Cytophaga sp. TaxID=160238 RepID=UPI002622C204|nr:hypothetical protein [uncultured Cytophaga sp.]
MNVLDIVKQGIHALLIYLIQVLVFRTTTLWDVAACFIYTGFLIQIPFTIPKVYTLLITFIFTFCIDIFFNTPGVHTAAALVMMYFRPNIINLLSPQGGYDSVESINIFSMGIQWHTLYAFIMIFIQTTLVFVIESIGSFSFGNSIVKIFTTTLLTLVVVILYQFLFLYKRNSR